MSDLKVNQMHLISDRTGKSAKWVRISKIDSDPIIPFDDQKIYYEYTEETRLFGSMYRATFLKRIVKGEIV
jgi:hypothetical protein